ncbi:hypothetical protein M441DRAFT_363148 [Trichoderma asperellum CBS 433.97]|uniref:Uncharacterized protein n=1 Tax=Trichoderma asperellum (strain ATCC 204424 / CBS 433.97 / NBRC 101777) TaxID=1042311 RepID=A0A2T3ZDY2_TRIA4|nr:hypothetical protein M441DRAFT_363148 [Trichoderma asperellum CBS 433.97]PTB43007.1 hypothetical protein M441DRAFT_363148 [Trichoderma asperellum CBS 433.97]
MVALSIGEILPERCSTSPSHSNSQIHSRSHSHCKIELTLSNNTHIVIFSSTHSPPPTLNNYPQPNSDTHAPRSIKILLLPIRLLPLSTSTLSTSTPSMPTSNVYLLQLPSSELLIGRW